MRKTGKSPELDAVHECVWCRIRFGPIWKSRSSAGNRDMTQSGESPETSGHPLRFPVMHAPPRPAVAAEKPPCPGRPRKIAMDQVMIVASKEIVCRENKELRRKNGSVPTRVHQVNGRYSPRRERFL